MLIGRAGDDRVVGQLVELLELRIAQDEAAVGVPQDEGFGNGLDRVAQTDIGGCGAFGEFALFRDVDADADDARSFVFRAHDFGAGTHPDPAAAHMADAEGAVDHAGFAAQKFVREFVKVDVARMHDRLELAERDEVVLRFHTDQFEH
jgi:hypothetical protein